SPHPGPGIGPDSRRGAALDFGPDRPRRLLRSPAGRARPAGGNLPPHAAGADLDAHSARRPEPRPAGGAVGRRPLPLAVRYAVPRRALLLDPPARRGG